MIMKNLGNWMKETTELSNKDRVLAGACTLALWGIGYAMTHVADKANCKRLQVELENDILRAEKEELERQVELYKTNYEYVINNEDK